MAHLVRFSVWQSSLFSVVTLLTAVLVQISMFLSLDGEVVVYVGVCVCVNVCGGTRGLCVGGD